MKITCFFKELDKMFAIWQNSQTCLLNRKLQIWNYNKCISMKENVSVLQQFA